MIDRKTLENFRKDFEKAMEALEKQYGCNMASSLTLTESLIHQQVSQVNQKYTKVKVKMKLMNKSLKNIVHYMV